MSMNNRKIGRKIGRSNTYRCRMVARNFPKMQKGILDKITVSNGFSIGEVREYKGRLRAIALDSMLDEPKMNIDFEDSKKMNSIFIWTRATEGRAYWAKLSQKLWNYE